MRGVCCIVALAFLAGCGSVPIGEGEAITYSGDGLEYSVVRPNAERPNGLSADLTLVDLDAELADELLYIDGPTDIAPRSFRNAMGEIAAVNASYGHGKLLSRTTIPVSAAQTLQWEWSVEYPYLQDWAGFSPVFGTVADGVTCEFEVNAVSKGYSLMSRSISSQLAFPIADFTTTLELSTPLKIQIPELSVIERVGTENVALGETAMFQLSRATHGDGERIRLMFVRLVESVE